MVNLFVDFVITALIYLLPPLIYLCLREKPLSDSSIKKVSWLFAIVTFILIVIVKVAIVYFNPETNIGGANIIAMFIWRWVICKIFVEYSHSIQAELREREKAEKVDNPIEKENTTIKHKTEKDDENFTTEEKKENYDCIDDSVSSEKNPMIVNDEMIELSNNEVLYVKKSTKRHRSKKVAIIFAILIFSTVILVFVAFKLGMEIEKHKNQYSDTTSEIDTAIKAPADTVFIENTSEIISDKDGNETETELAAENVDFVFIPPTPDDNYSIDTKYSDSSKLELNPAGRNENGEIINGQGLTLEEYSELNKYRIKKLQLTTPVKKGEVAFIEIQGLPNTEYTLQIFFGTGTTQTNSSKKTSDESGKVSWSWKIDLSTNAGSHRIVITGGDDSYSTKFVVY